MSPLPETADGAPHARDNGSNASNIRHSAIVLKAAKA
jgi:hypothetical protein